LEKIMSILTDMGIEIGDIEDRRESVKLKFDAVTETYWADQGKVWPKGHIAEGQPIMLRDYQVEAINTFLENPQSLQEIATGAGKTITTATLSQLCEPYGRTITIVPNKSLVEQTEEDFINVGLDVGVYYGDRKDLNKTHTICTWQSLNILDKKSKNQEHDILTLAEFLDGVGAVIVDEVHMAKAEVLKNLLTQNLSNAPIRWGLTGTVPKEAFEYEQIFASIGPVVGGIAAHELQDKGVLSQCHVNIVQMIDIPEFKMYQEELKYLVTDENRMRYIGALVKQIAQTGNTLVLVNRIDSGKFLVNEIEDSVFISGEVKTTTRKEEYDEVKTSTNKVIVATYGVAAVGINIPRIFNLVLLESGKSFTRVIQSIGRGIRKAEDKDFVQIWDITSTCKFAKRHLTQRKKFYKDAKYPFTLDKVDWSK
jgi:superfamily II DNA or RNA helicase